MNLSYKHFSYILIIQYTAVLSMEKQTVMHIAFQNTAHCSFFREEQTATHVASQVKSTFFPTKEFTSIKKYNFQ